MEPLRNHTFFLLCSWMIRAKWPGRQRQYQKQFSNWKLLIVSII